MKRKRFLLTPLLLMSLLVVPWVAQAQTLSNYILLTGVDASKAVALPSNARQVTFSTAEADDVASTEVYDIGFTFNLAGTNYTKWSINSNANLKLGDALIGGSSMSTPFSSSNLAQNTPKIIFWGRDVSIRQSYGHYIKYATVGTSPNRKLVIEVRHGVGYSTGQQSIDSIIYQYQLDEGSNAIRMVAMRQHNTSAWTSYTYQTGVALSATSVFLINPTTHTGSHATTYSSTLYSGWPGDGRYYEVVPDTRSCHRVENIALSGLTDVQATVSWSPANTGATYHVTYTNNTTGQTRFVNAGTDTSLTMTGLMQNTYYSVNITTICSASDSSYPSAAPTFRTACTPIATADLPWREDFDGYASGSTTQLSACYAKGYVTASTGAANLTSYPYPYSAQHYSGGNSLYFYCTSTTYPQFALPMFQSPLADLQLNFKMLRTTSTAYYGRVIVGVQRTQDDYASFIPVDTLACTKTSVWEEFTSAKFNRAPAGYNYIVIRERETSTGHAYIDDITVGRRSACTTPTDVLVATAAPTSATISWTSSAANAVVEYDTVPFLAGHGLHHATYSTTGSASISGLLSDRNYYVRVRAICGAGDTTLASELTFRTPCANASLPYIENFEGYAAATNTQLNSCYTKGYVTIATGYDNKATYPYPSTTVANSGTNSIYFYSTSTVWSYLVLPYMSVPLDSLQMSVQLRKTATTATYGRLEVGVMSSPTNWASFQLIDTIAATEANLWEEKLVNFTGVPNGKRFIVIRSKEASAGYAYIDDIMVARRSSCARPEDLEVTSLFDVSANLSWTAASGATGYAVEYDYASFTPGSGSHHLQVVNTNSATLTGLTPNSRVFAYVRAICGVGDTTMPVGIDFNTACAAQSLPYYNNFDSYGTGTAAAINCMYKGYVTRSTGAEVVNNYPYPYASQHNSGTASLYFYSSATNYSYLVLPLVNANLNDLQVSFMLRKSSASYGRMKVAVATNPLDPSTFTVVGRVQPATVNVWEGVSVSLANYSGTGRYIVLLCDTTVANYAYVDDIMITRRTSCTPVASTTVTTPRSTRVNVSWPAVSGAAGYVVETAPTHFFPGQRPAGLNSTYTTLTSATLATSPSSTFYGYVYTVCGRDTSMAMPFTGTTGCQTLAETPYYENFDSYSGNTISSPINPCWTKGQYNQTLAINKTDSMPRLTNMTTAPSYTSNGIVYSGPNALFMPTISQTVSGSDGSSTTQYKWTYVVLPQTATADLRNLVLRAKVFTNSTSYYLQVGVVSAPSSPTTFTSIGNLLPTAPYEWQELEVDLSNYTGTYQYLAIRSYPTSSASYIFIDDIAIYEKSNCNGINKVQVVEASDTRARLAWNGMRNGVECYVTYSTEKHPQGDFLHGTTLTGTATGVELTSLQPNTTYYYQVRTICSNGDTSIPYDGSFRTGLPQPLPIVQDFESWPTTTNTTETPQGYDKMYTYYGTTHRGYYPYASTTQHASGARSLYMYGASTNASILVLPMANRTLEGTQISFKALKSSATVTYGHIDVGVLGNRDDASTFHRLAHFYVNSMNTWETFTLSLNGAEQYGKHVAIRLSREDGTNYVYIDDLRLEVAPACAQPSVRLVANLDTTATISWQRSGSNLGYVVELADEPITPGTGEGVEVHYTTDTFYTFNGLLPASINYVYVRTICGPRDTTSYTVLRFTTGRCVVADTSLPYVEDFDSYTSGSTNPINPCWIKYYMTGRTTNSYPYPYTTQHHSGANGLYCYAGSTVGSYVALPAFESRVQDLMLDFWMIRTAASYTAPMVVGVVTDPLEPNTFEEVARFVPSQVSTWTQFHVEFRNYTGQGRYIAFYYQISNVGSYCYLDDIVVSKYTPCQSPRDLRVLAAYDSVAYVTWNDTNASAWVVEYDTVAFGSTSSFPTRLRVTNDTIQVPVVPASTYYMRVRGLCDGGDSSDFTSQISFTTATCAALPADSLPYFDDFDHYGTGTATTINPCWTKYYSYGWNQQSYPYPLSNATYAHSGGISLYFYRYNSTSYWYGGYLCLPLIADSLQNLMVDFWAAKSSTTAYYGYWDVGVMSNPRDTSTFEVVRQVYVPTTGAPTHFEVDFSSYRGIGRYISFRLATPQNLWTSTSASAYGYLDDVTVRRVPSCWYVSNARVLSSQARSAVVAWDAHDTSAHDFEVEVALANDSTFVPGTSGNYVYYVSDTNAVELYNLQPNTEYVAYIRQDCGGEYGEFRSVNFTTQCLIENTDLPYRDDFESYTASSTALLNPCYFKMHNTSASQTTYPYPTGTYAKSGSKSLYLYSTMHGSATQQFSMLAMPNTETPLRGLMVSFDLYKTSANYGWLQVGAINTVTDSHDFEPIVTVQASQLNTWEHFDVSLANYTGLKERLAIRAFNPTSTAINYVYLDNLEIDAIRPCGLIESVALDSVSENFARITWSDTNTGATAWKVEYAGEDFTPGNGDGVMRTVNTRSINLTGLMPSTEYHVWVGVDCGALRPYYREIVFKTPCAPIPRADLPFEENFESYTAATTTPLSPCYYKKYTSTNVTNSYPYPSATYAYSGSQSLYFYQGSAGIWSYVVLPLFEDSLQALSLQAKLLKTSTSTNYGHVQVGVMSNPNDTATFEPVTTFSITQDYYTWQPFSTDFRSYHGTGRYIALRSKHPTMSTSQYVYLDDLRVSLLSACSAPLAVSTSVSGNTVNVTINDPAHRGRYVVEHSNRNFNPGDGLAHQLFTTDTTVAITDARPGVLNRIAVRAICGAGDTSGAVFAAVTMPCAPIDSIHLPYYESFENYPVSTTAALSTCWHKGYVTRASGVVSRTSYPYPSSTSHSGNTSLYFYCSSTNYSYISLDSIAVPLDSLTLSFSARKTTSYYRGMYVGVTRHPDSMSTFIPIASINPPTTTDWEDYRINLEGIPSTHRYITFKLDSVNAAGTTGYTSYCYIDDVVLARKSRCTWMTDFAAGALDSVVYFTWEEGSNTLSRDLMVDTLADFSTATTYHPTSSSFRVTHLQPGKTYYAQVRAVCGAGDASDWVQTHFTTTTCAPLHMADLPWSEGFESYAASSTTTLDPCWTKAYVTLSSNSKSRTSYPYPSSTAAAAHSGARSLYFYQSSTTNAYISFQALGADVPLDSMQTSFWVYTSATSYYGHVRVGLTSDPDDMSTFYELAHFHNPASSQNQYEFTFSGAPESHRYLTILGDTLGVNYFYIDDVVIEHQPSCPRPRSMQVLARTDTSATITWVGGSPDSWKVRVADNPTYSGATTYQLTRDTLLLHNLRANTVYYVELKNVCGAGDTSDAREFTFRTDCGTILTMPFIEGFESYGTGTTTQIPCWTKGYVTISSGAVNTATYPYPSTTSPHSGSANLYMYAASTTYCYMSSPEFGIPLDSLHMIFWTRTSTSTYRGLHVGVTSDPSDMSTFIEVYNASNTSTTYTMHEVNFYGIPSTHRYITFKLDSSNAAGTTHYISAYYIDDITIDYKPACPTVSGVRATSISDVSASIAWDSTSALSWIVSIDTLSSMSTAWSYVDTVPRHTFTGLSPQHTYYVNVVAACSATDTSEALRILYQFTTPCAVISHADLPYVENFDRYQAGSTSYPISPCWTKFYYSGASAPVANSYPYPTASYAHSGGVSLYFYGYSTAASYAALPLFEDSIQNLILSFWAYKTSSTATYGVMDVGVMTDPRDTNTFERVRLCTLSTYSQWQHIEVPMSSYTGNGRYIAIRARKGATNYFYIDDVSVAADLPCPRITNVAVRPRVHVAELVWSTTGGSATPTSYTVTLMRHTDSAVTRQYTTDQSIMLFDLESTTEYTAYIQANCGAQGDGYTESITFTTECGRTEDEVSASTTGSSATTTYYLPVSNYSSTSSPYSYTQQVFSSNELNGAREISGIAFQYNYSQPTAAKQNVTIYLGYSPRATITTWVPFDSLSAVYTGPLEAAQGWNTLYFDRPFSYNGTGNLVLAIDDNSGSSNSSSFSFNGHSISNKALYAYATTDINPQNPIAAVASTVRNNVRWLTCSDTICLEPFVRVDSTDATQAYITIAAGNAEDSWKVRYRQHGATTWTYGTDATATRHTIRTLSPGVQYDAEVGA
ncbi:MAG: choice-of-anchor J domain-containing protein, partial [Bacteroidales bacterium]|nr:choice-of-anchor J domain-containing protein [Bacteroidales bacterium]